MISICLECRILSPFLRTYMSVNPNPKTLEWVDVIHKLQTIIHKKTYRFVLVGSLNTLVNFVILDFSFYELKLSKIASNIVATCIALMFSFILNRNFVFVHRGMWLKQFVIFASLTVVGTLVINNAVYIFSLAILENHVLGLSHMIAHTGLVLSTSFITVNGSAAIATVFSMVWNYNAYNRIVFRGAKLEKTNERN